MSQCTFLKESEIGQNRKYQSKGGFTKFFQLVVIKRSPKAASLVEALLCGYGKWGPQKVGNLSVVTSRLGPWDLNPAHCYVNTPWPVPGIQLAWVFRWDQETEEPLTCTWAGTILPCTWGRACGQYPDGSAVKAPPWGRQRHRCAFLLQSNPGGLFLSTNSIFPKIVRGQTDAANGSSQKTDFLAQHMNWNIRAEHATVWTFLVSCTTKMMLEILSPEACPWFQSVQRSL